jgi:hypothetical protein
MANGLGGRVTGGLAKGDVGIGQLSEALGTGSASWLGSLKKLQVANIKLDLTWENKDSLLDWASLRVTATSAIGGTIGQIELITGTLDPVRGFVLVAAVTVDTPRAAAILLGDTCPNVNSSYLAKFPPMTARIVFSTATISASQSQFVPNENRVTQTTVNAGVAMELAYLTPASCDGVELQWFCNAAVRSIGSGSYLKLTGYLQVDEWLFGLEAKVAGVQFSDSFSLTEAGIFVQMSPKEISMGLRGKIMYTADDRTKLNFTGMVKIGIINGLPALELSFTSQGMWTNVFGLEPVSVGNLALGGALAIVPPPVFLAVTKFNIGGEITIGNNCANKATSKCIGGRAYIGIDLLNPVMSYFMLDTLPLNLDQIVAALAPPEFSDVFKYFPECIKQTGFPKGLFISYASKGVTLDNGVQIKSGFNFKGVFNFLGYEINAEIGWVFKKSLKMNFKFAPLILCGGALKVTDRLGSTSVGPIFLLEINYASLISAAMSPPRLLAQAAVEVLGIGVEAAIEISTFYFRLELTGRLFGGQFEVSIKVLATLGLSASLTGSAARFEFTVQMLTKSRETVQLEMEDKVKKGAEQDHNSLGSMVTDTQKLIANLTASSKDAQQCWASCGATENCLAAFEQCKDPYYSKDVERTCTTDLSSCSDYEQENVCIKWGMWGFGWWCSESQPQCCSRVLTNNGRKACQATYDNCLTQGGLTGWATIFKGVFTGNFGLAWCATACKAKDVALQVQIGLLKAKIFGLQTLQTISRGAELLWTGITKVLGAILTINNITAQGVLAPAGSSFTFAVDMKVLLIPIKGSFTIGTAPDSKANLEALAGNTISAARDILTDESKRSSLPTQLLQVTQSHHTKVLLFMPFNKGVCARMNLWCSQLYDGTWAVDDNSPVIEEQMRLSLCAYQVLPPVCCHEPPIPFPLFPSSVLLYFTSQFIYWT